MTLTYFFSSRLVSTILPRRCRLRLPVLWLFRCFLPAWLRLSLPVSVSRKRYLAALWVWAFGMGTLGPPAPRGTPDGKNKGAPGSDQGSRKVDLALAVEGDGSV